MAPGRSVPKHLRCCLEKCDFSKVTLPLRNAPFDPCFLGKAKQGKLSQDSKDFSLFPASSDLTNLAAQCEVTPPYCAIPFRDITIRTEIITNENLEILFRFRFRNGKTNKFPQIFFRIRFCNGYVGHAQATAAGHTYE